MSTCQLGQAGFELQADWGSSEDFSMFKHVLSASHSPGLVELPRACSRERGSKGEDPACIMLQISCWTEQVTSEAQSQGEEKNIAPEGGIT